MGLTRNSSPESSRRQPNQLFSKWTKFLKSDNLLQDPEIIQKPETNLKFDPKSFRSKYKRSDVKPITYNYGSSANFYKKKEEHHVDLKDKWDNFLDKIDGVEHKPEECQNRETQGFSRKSKKYYDVIFENTKKTKNFREDLEDITSKYESEYIEIQGKRIYDYLTTLDHGKHRHDRLHKLQYRKRTEEQTHADQAMMNNIVNFTQNSMGMPKMVDRLKRDYPSFFTAKQPEQH